MKPLPLDADTLTRALTGLPGWQRQDQSLYRDYRFASFVDAMAFMQAVAALAEAMNHHPDWCNSHSRVEVRLTTHASGGITALDIALAQAMERLARRSA